MTEDTQGFNRMMLVMAGMVALMFIASGIAWNQIPADMQIPVHWGIDGKPDRFGSKTEGLLLMPAIALVTVILFRLVPVIEPRKKHLLQSSNAYVATAVTVTAFMACLHFLLLGNLLELVIVGIETGVPFLLGLMFVVIGNYLGKVRSNFMFGVRTPWTLTSELSWNKTHRLTGKLFVAAGGLSVLSVFIIPYHSFYVLLTLTIGAGLVSIVYSYLVWRDDPDRRTG